MFYWMYNFTLYYLNIHCKIRRPFFPLVSVSFKSLLSIGSVNHFNLFSPQWGVVLKSKNKTAFRIFANRMTVLVQTLSPYGNIWEEGKMAHSKSTMQRNKCLQEVLRSSKLKQESWNRALSWGKSLPRHTSWSRLIICIQILKPCISNSTTDTGRGNKNPACFLIQQLMVAWVLTDTEDSHMGERSVQNRMNIQNW